MKTRRSRPLLAITMGDPCGVGPEIIVKALADADLHEVCVPLVIGDPLALNRAVDLLNAPLEVRKIEDLTGIEKSPWIIHVMASRELTLQDLGYGNPSETACRQTIDYIRMAVQLALNGDIDGLCTCPIHKGNLHQHGFAFPGHTEFLQHLTGAHHVVMMLAGPRLRVALVTIHHALADVPKLLNRDLVSRTIRITAEGLMKDFGLKSPRVAVAGLNPHAGEEGRFGSEESELIAPVIKSFEGAPYVVSGPYPADTVFLRALDGEFDAVIAMYHDQGLIPVKLLYFHDAVNVTLGLPIIRTSVDHGTAYDLAGTGRADAGSLRAAVRLAAAMTRNRS